MILPIYASLERVDPRLIEAAGDLYANGLTTLRKVTFPLSMPGVVAGTLLTFIPAAGDYVNSALLGDPVHTTMVGNVIDSRFLRVVDYPTAAVLSLILMVSILVMVGVLHPPGRHGGAGMSSATVTGPAAGRQQPLGRRVGRWLSRNAIRIYAVIAFTYLFIPVAYTLAFSFNDSGKSNIAWQGFTLDKWKNPCGAPDVCTRSGQQPQDRADGHAHRDPARHDGRLRAGPAPLPWPDRRPT